MNDPKIFFQSSMPRVGSTIFQNLIGQNPNFYVSPTSALSNFIQGSTVNFIQDQNFRNLPDLEKTKKAYYNFCRGGILEYYKTFSSKPFILDKGRGWLYDLNLLSKIFPNPKVIVLVRDLRDVVASHEKIYIKDPTTKYAWSDFVEKYRDVNIEDRYKIYFDYTSLGVYLKFLYSIITSITPNNIHFVRFEDLCTQPTKILRNIYNYLEIPYYDHNFSSIDQITTENDNDHLFGLHKISTQLKLPDTTHQQILPQHISDKIYGQYKWYFDYFKYSY